MSWIDTRGAECGARCDVSSIGLSYEGNDQKLIKVLMCGGIFLHCIIATNWISEAIIGHSD